MDQQPNQEQPQPQNQPTTSQESPSSGPVVVPQQSFGTMPSASPPSYPAPKKSSKKPIVVILVLLVLVAAGAAAYWFLIRKDNKTAPTNTQKNTSSEQKQSQSDEKTDESNHNTWVPLDLHKELTLTHDGTWTAKDWGGTKGLIKDVGGIKYLIALGTTTFDYDYMDRAAGGAYPVGTLYKTVATSKGKSLQVGTFSFGKAQDGAFVSTCPLTSNGGCSIKVADSVGGGHSYWILELDRYLPEKDTDPRALAGAKDYLDLTNPTDKQVLDEFVAMLATLTF
jgi:hypothetical protein